MDFSEPTAFARDLVGEEISQVWRGAGTSVFLEVGPLEQVESGARRGSAGCIGIEWSWRIEQGPSIVGGSFSDDEAIDRVVALLEKKRIEEIEFFGRIPEIAVTFSSGHRLLSFATIEGDPEWSIRVGNRYLSVASGLFVYENAA